MGLRRKLKQLEQAARGRLGSFELASGETYYYRAGFPLAGRLYLHHLECLKAGAGEWPEPPEVYRKLTEARDPAAALKQITGDGPHSLFPYDEEALVRERRLVPRALVVGGEGDPSGGLKDLSD